MLTPKPWRADRIVWLAAALLAGMSLGTLVVQGYQAFLPKEGNKAAANLLVMMLGTLMYHGIALVLVGIFVRQHQLTWSEAFGFNAPRRSRAIILAVLTFFVVLPIAWSLRQLSEIILVKAGLTPQVQQAVQALGAAESGSERLYFFIVAVVLAPVIEEIFFRGILYTAIKKFASPNLALWIASAAFALMHVNMVTFLPLLFFAVILTFLYETTGNLLASIIAHSLFNATNFILLLWQAAPAVKS